MSNKFLYMNNKNYERKMKNIKLITGLVLISVFTYAKGQDRIITTQNDTIFCQIAYVSSTRIAYVQDEQNGRKGKFISREQVKKYHQGSSLPETSRDTLDTGIYLHRQINSNGFVFRLNGNYNETNTDNMLHNINAYSAVSKTGNVSLSAGYMRQHWLFGLGFEYSRNKTIADGTLYERLYDEQSRIVTTAFREQSEVTLNMYGGMFYTNYYLSIYRNLYFTPGFYLGCGHIKGNYSRLTGARQLIFKEENSLSVYLKETPITDYEGKISSNYFYTQLSPELTWFFSNRFGLNLQAGGLGIDVIDSDWRNASKQINFNPSFWKLGILFKL